MHWMGDERLDVVDIQATDALCKATLGGFAARNASHVLLLLYNQATRGDPIHDCAVTVRAGSAGVHSAASTSTVYRIDQDHAAPKAAWESLGAPQWPTAAQNAKILAASEMRPEAVAVGADGDFDVGVLPPQGVVGVVIPRA